MDGVDKTSVQDMLSHLSGTLVAGVYGKMFISLGWWLLPVRPPVLLFVLLRYLHLQPGYDPLGLGEDLGVGEAVDGATAHRPVAELGEEVAHEGLLVSGLFPGSFGEEGVI